LIRHSEGGLIAPMIAADDPTLRGIVLLAGPSQSGRQVIGYQRRYAIGHALKLSSAAGFRATADPPLIDSIANSVPWMRFFVDYDPLPTARRAGCLLILQGTTDREVTWTSQALARDEGGRSKWHGACFQVNHLFVHGR
jgi:pimeloyl-ACP methyl ester carboxylesterase